MTDFKLGPFAGIDTHSPEPTSAPGLLRVAVNVDIDRDGGIGRRNGLASVREGEIRSLYGTKRNGRLVYVEGGRLKLATPNTPTVQDLGPIDEREVEYVEYNSDLIISGARTLLISRNYGPAEGLGVEAPPPPVVGVSEAGGFQAGRYGVLITFIAENHEESAASEAVFRDLAEGEGLDIQGLPVPFESKVRAIRIYRTTTNGDVFYADQDIPLPHAGAFLLNPGDNTLGRACVTRHFSRMAGGRHPRHWRGRLIVARGPNLYLSEPMRYGLYDPRHGFIQFPTFITFLQPVLGGIFVGQRDGVFFLRGTSPGELEMIRTGAGVPVPGSSTEIAGEQMSGEFAQKGQQYAVWLGERGYAIGLPDGDVVEPQSTRLAVPVGQRGVTVVHNRRLTTLVT